KMRRREFLIAAAAAMAPLGARAQAYPSKAINWVVGFPPGGGADGVTRLVAAKLSQNIGQPVVVENRPGASSIIAAQYVAQAAPDGYTIWSTEQGGLIFNTALYSKLPYDPQRDFTPISDMIRAPIVLAVNPSFPAQDLASFVEYVRKNPGKLNYGSPGRGLAHQLAMEAFKQKAKLDIVDVQYKGIAPVVQDVVAGQIPMGPIDTVVVLPHLRSGKLRGLASFSEKRLSATPDVPAMGELGYAGLEIAPIVGVVAPARTPRDIVARLNAEVVKAVRDAEVSAKLSGLGLEIIADTPEQFAFFLQEEGRRWLPFIRSLNIKLD
ncbi:MAG TPA: tripartite tricarboxylate transporter substrate binding protein, partial [Burkholderiales bacterium]|nr:tripartite tricarboxylate transporter substrate binding protein [Burkholderiales bacterium]